MPSEDMLRGLLAAAPDEMARNLMARKPEICVLFMSGYDSGGAGLGRHLLEKPVAEPHLLRMIREMLDG